MACQRRIDTMVMLKKLQCLLAAALLTGGTVWAQETEKRPPDVPPPAKLPARGPARGGLASRYPGDRGIGRDPAVVFHDDFEAGEVGKKWDEVSVRRLRNATVQAPALAAETDAAIARGTRSARAALHKDSHSDVSLFKRFSPPGFDELYMRHYVRYGPDYGYHHHGGSGFTADWVKAEFRRVGKVYDGDKFYWATLEPTRPDRGGPPGAIVFYAYWWKMKPDGRGNHWGDWFRPQPDHIPPLQTWTCVEWRVRTNTAGQENGELDCWINAKKCGEFRNINWRSVDTLKINRVHLILHLEPDEYQYYDGGTTRTVWYDDVVVATEYIGPKAP
jgi:hypothetical protein